MKKLLLAFALLLSPIAVEAQTTNPATQAWVGANFCRLTGCTMTGAFVGTTVALGGATIGSNALAVTGTANISGSVTIGAASGYVVGTAFGIFNNSSTTAAFRNTANNADVAITASSISLSGGVLAFGGSGPKVANNTGAVIDVTTNDGSTLTAFRAASVVMGGSAVTVTAVNSVSPTSPNRTITISYGGTTYYLAAKTTND